MLPPLEGAGLRICIDHRNFELGKIAQLNMEDCVSASRRVILVMSPAWIRSEWGSYEFLFTAVKDPTGRTGKLVPVLISPIPASELPERLLLRTYYQGQV